MAVTFFLLIVSITSGLAAWFSKIAYQISGVFSVSVLIYFSLFFSYFLLAGLPLSVYSGYFLEKKYELSNQTLLKWWGEWLKKTLLSFVMGLLIFEVAYWIFEGYPAHAWWMIWAAWTACTLILGRLAPVLIFPIFYKFRPLENGPLKESILKLVETNGLPIQDVYVFNMSKTTKKANAAFCGMGKTRRVILADTLVENFPPEEIQAVVAHEMGHAKLNHIWKRVFWGTAISFLFFFAAYRFCSWLSLGLEYNGIADLAFFPILALAFFLFNLLLMPAENAYSRKHEFEADDFAYEKTKAKTACISVMERLARMNLADPQPNPVIEFLLYDHPSIPKRIARFKAHEG
ncbi:MAG: M48 family metallopeptidase [Candidatus Omnitrophica bacterium]|nr:M48 family metallopeptidase [Candidatus Omnitrophota bacterium]